RAAISTRAARTRCRAAAASARRSSRSRRAIFRPAISTRSAEILPALAANRIRPLVPVAAGFVDCPAGQSSTRIRPMSLTVTPLPPLFVAEIRGVDLRQPIDAVTQREIERAMDQYAVCVIPDQPLGDEQQIAFARLYGPLE